MDFSQPDRNDASLKAAGRALYAGAPYAIRLFFRWERAEICRRHALPLPQGSGRFSSNFNWRWGSFHEGIDIGVPEGTPVYAAHVGRVVFAGRRGGYGNLVVLRGEGIMTVYGHNRSLRVSKGDTVTRGRVLAQSGSTGHASGSHLHFETRLLDPGVHGYVAVDSWVFYRNRA